MVLRVFRYNNQSQECLILVINERQVMEKTDNVNFVNVKFFNDGHSTLKTLVLVRSLKLCL